MSGEAQSAEKGCLIGALFFLALVIFGGRGMPRDLVPEPEIYLLVPRDEQTAEPGGDCPEGKAATPGLLVLQYDV